MGTLQGKFRPINPSKYSGNIGEIYYRSSWELCFLNWCDKTTLVESYSSEEKVVPYYDPIAKKCRRYFPDFIIKYKNKQGKTITEMVEIKPYRQVIGPPENPTRRTKSWINAVKTYCTNQAKWKAAEKFCEERGWKFKIITEKDLFGP